MEFLVVDALEPDSKTIELVAARLRQGAVVAYPTETFYGLGAGAFESAAHQRIFELKGRDTGKPLPLIASDLSQLEMLTDRWPNGLERLAEAFWPGPLTLVVPARPGLGGPFANAKTVAVRVSGSAIARGLARAVGCPLTATSANPTQQPPPTTAQVVRRTLGANLDLILDGGPTPGGRPSTIVDLSDSEPRLLREGPICFEDVSKILGARSD